MAERKHSFALVMIDVDRFKGVNDRYGHGVGDQVLLALAQSLKALTRRADMAARLAGDEFTVLLSDLDAAGVDAWYQRLDDHFKAGLEAFGLDLQTGLSAGQTWLGSSAVDSMNAALIRADHALYQAKAQGRDQAGARRNIPPRHPGVESTLVCLSIPASGVMIETDRLIAPAAVSRRKRRSSARCGPSSWPSTSARRRSAASWRSSSRRRASAARRSTTCCCSARRAWARPRWRTSSRARWASICARPPGRCWSAPGDLAALLTNLEPNDVLFIDEIHRLSPVVEEILYPALEDFQIDIMIGEGPAARSVKLDLPPFTLVGATTRAGMLTNPLRDRFGIVARLEFYYAGGTCARSCSARPRLLKVESAKTRARWKSPAARAARRASPTACCAACAITPRSRPTARSPRAVADAGADDAGRGRARARRDGPQAAARR